MKRPFVCAMLFALISCGKNPSGQTPSGNDINREDLEERATASMPDLLNVSVDVRAEISANQIVFLNSVTAADRGSGHVCEISIKQGEIWRLRMANNTMIVDGPPNHTFTYQMYSPNVWNSSRNFSGMKVLRRFSLLGDRVILNQDCEG